MLPSLTDTPVGMTVIPQIDPNWNYQPGQQGLDLRDHMVLCLLESERRCIKLVNYDNLREITQGPNDNPALFYPVQ